MAIYQSYGYGSEKTAVVFDIGTAYTKVGFVGENGPRNIVQSKITDKEKKIYGIYDQYSSDEELYDRFVDFFHMLYFKHLLVNPKERRVVVAESILTPSVFRNVIAKVLFMHYEVPSLLFAPSHLMSLLTLGISSAVVIDVGYKDTLVLPIYEEVPILKGWQSLPLAGKAIHNCLEANLLENATVLCEGRNKPLASVMEKVDERILEDIKVRCCFVTKYDRAQKIQMVSQGKADPSEAPTPPPGLDYPIEGNKVLYIDGKLRENTCEVLFEQDNEEQSIATLVLDAILKCSVDIRRTLAANLVVTGGTAMLPGFEHRLLCELRALVKLPKYAPHVACWEFRLNKPPAKSNYVSWLGGAIFGNLDILALRSIPRKSYLEQSILPDWCCLFEAEEKEDKTWLALKTERPTSTSSLAESPLAKSGTPGSRAGSRMESGDSAVATPLTTLSESKA